MFRAITVFVCLLLATSALFVTEIEYATSAGRKDKRHANRTEAVDPGVRQGDAGAGAPLAGLSRNELLYFEAGLEDFEELETAEDGMGPTMNADGCAACHMHPAVGGTSPPINPQVALANALGAMNVIPSFIQRDGPVREARFIRNPDGTPDGGVHNVFTIAGRSDAPGCYLPQPDFATEQAKGNIIFRIPTPVFGAGLMEQIPDSAILANQAKDAPRKRSLGIRGRPNIVLSGSTISGQPNRNGNDGTLARFGWKAQNKSLLLFSGEAYNVEMGITNELFQTERDETESCYFGTIPNDTTNTDAATPIEALSGVEKFALFMRFLAPPTPSTDTPGGVESITNGSALFESIGCSLCHTPVLNTGTHATVAALNDQEAHLFSDMLLHDMGPDLADGVTQGQAGPSEFRTAPLWGLGKRLFFLHDGRTSDLVVAIQEHKSKDRRSRNPSEANAVVDNYNALGERDKQDVLNFLRSL